MNQIKFNNNAILEYVIDKIKDNENLDIRFKWHKFAEYNSEFNYSAKEASSILESKFNVMFNTKIFIDVSDNDTMLVFDYKSNNQKQNILELEKSK